MKLIPAICILVMILYSGGLASGDKVFIASIDSIDDMNVFADYPGKYWGKAADKIILYGGNSEEDWLAERNITFESRDFGGDSRDLFLVYVDYLSELPDNIGVVYRGDGYVLSQYAPAGDFQYRQLSLMQYPVRDDNTVGNVILEYNAAIDDIISQVSRDTLIEFLAGLTGESQVWINGQPETIVTRFSPTEGNELAAAYLKEKLSGYGYQAEYHSFYTGNMRNIAMYDENLAWMTLQGPRAFRTTNGGASWVFMAVYTPSDLWGVTNSGPDSVWVTGDRGVIKFSWDGGESFYYQNYIEHTNLFAIDFINNVEGWISGDSGTVLHTTNSGWSWLPQSTPVTTRLFDVCFVDDEYGWSVGDSGVVIHTTDGGDNWLVQNANTGSRLYGIEFTDRNNGWLCGWYGVVRRTTDGGANWQTVDLGTSGDKYHVDFPNSTFGCIVGSEGDIYTTTDGGDSWRRQSSNTLLELHCVSFADSLNGVACGRRIITRTTDGGITWIEETGNHEDAWRNVVATRAGTLYPDEEVVICAHFDNTSQVAYDVAPGADDNGSGTAAVIEAARLFAGESFERTVKFCLWTGEEQGMQGSEAYAANAYVMGDNIVGVYNFDMIAYDSDGDDVMELHCGTVNSSIDLGNLFMTVIDDYNIGLDPRQVTFGSTNRSDHASFWDYNYPAILGIEDFSDDFNPYYHTTNDIIANFDTSYFTYYVKAAIGAAATLAIPDTTVSIVDRPESLPSGFALHGNYPNPFNGATTISFTLTSKADIDLAVYDLLGRRVAQLYEGRLDGGSHRITWNAAEMSSGIYFYRLRANGGENVGRMMLLK